ncbi:MAG TPA: type II toxin-antitoxin system VapC family toxin [Rhizomicrobium sp.]|nr:type II toxin-antitoxin system VapC family toxin [Rhizomicrobium sp.]
MIGLDTNVLIRYVTQDDPVNSPKATRFIEGQLTRRSPGYVSTVALVEAVWVLDSSYGFSDRQIAAFVEGLLSSETILVENAADAAIALMAVKRGVGDFTDVLLGAGCRRAGCAYTVTFDGRASRMRGFAPVP